MNHQWILTTTSHSSHLFVKKAAYSAAFLYIEQVIYYVGYIIVAYAASLFIFLTMLSGILVPFS